MWSKEKIWERLQEKYHVNIMIRQMIQQKSRDDNLNQSRDKIKG